jgi:hypothetical protein
MNDMPLRIVLDGSWAQVWRGTKQIATFYNQKDATRYVEVERLRRRKPKGKSQITLDPALGCGDPCFYRMCLTFLRRRVE